MNTDFFLLFGEKPSSAALAALVQIRSYRFACSVILLFSAIHNKDESTREGLRVSAEKKEFELLKLYIR